MALENFIPNKDLQKAIRRNPKGMYDGVYGATTPRAMANTDYGPRLSKVIPEAIKYRESNPGLNYLQKLPTTTTMDPVWDQLIARSNVPASKLKPGSDGDYNWKNKLIRTQQGLSGDNLRKTLSHEAIHPTQGSWDATKYDLTTPEGRKIYFGLLREQEAYGGQFRRSNPGLNGKQIQSKKLVQDQMLSTIQE